MLLIFGKTTTSTTTTASISLSLSSWSKAKNQKQSRNPSLPPPHLPLKPKPPLLSATRENASPHPPHHSDEFDSLIVLLLPPPPPSAIGPQNAPEQPSTPCLRPSFRQTFPASLCRSKQTLLYLLHLHEALRPPRRSKLGRTGTSIQRRIVRIS